jgi:TolA-binding protein
MGSKHDMMPDWDPYEVLISVHNRTNGLEEAVRQLQNNILELNSLIRKQTQVMKHQEIIINQLRSHQTRQDEIMASLIDACPGTRD